MRGRLLLVLALALSLVGSVADPSGASVAGPTAPPGGQILGQLPWSAPGPEAVKYRSVSCAAADHCVALGESSAAGGVSLPVAVTMTPGGFSTTRLPVPPLPYEPVASLLAYPQALSCPTTEFCVALSAAGDTNHQYRPVVHVLAAGSWSGLALPLPFRAVSADVHTISCPVAGVCVATGSFTDADNRTSSLVETLRDGQWTTQVLSRSLTRGADLRAVSCPVDGWCAVLARRGTRLVELRLAAGVWTSRAVPSAAGATDQTPVAISCPQVDECTAVVSYVNGPAVAAFALRMASTTTRVTTLPTPGGAFARPVGIDCGDPTHCVAVAQLPNHRVAWSWAGAGWTRQELPPSSGAVNRDELDAVDCTSATTCVAVGSSGTTVGASYDGLVETLAAGAWTAQTQPAPGVPYAEAVGVSCSGDLHCTAIGLTKDLSGHPGLLTETQVDNTWAAAGVTVPAGSGLVASGISCPVQGQCVASGRDEATGGIFVATQVGARAWTITTPSVPGRIEQAYAMTPPSCPAVGHCVVAASYVERQTGEHRQVALTLDGGTWTPVELPVPADTAGFWADPSSVSCPTTTWCTVVGDYQSRTGVKNYSATLSNGVWSVATIPEPGHAGTFASISCPVVGGCVAVGYSAFKPSGRVSALTATLSGGTWTLAMLSIPPSSGGFQQLYSVSCRSVTSCVAVGDSSDHALIARLVSGSWKRTDAPNPVGGQSGLLRSVSCGTLTCTAVGHARTVDGGLKPFFAMADLG